MKTAALAFGYWSQNIGNAFFQLGGQALLSRALGPESVSLVQDVPAHWTLHRKSKGNPENWWNLISRVGADYMVFQGPSLDSHSHEALDSTLGELVRRGVEPVFLSIGLMGYSEHEAELARQLIDRHGVRVVVTRDRCTSEALEGRATYDGIDSAFFLPWAVTPVPLVADPYVALSFERIVEPTEAIQAVVAGRELTDAPNSVGRARALADRAGHRSQSAAYAVHRLWPPQRRQKYGDLDAVRLVHRTNPAHVGKIFHDANVVAADEPYSYITTYAHATLTLTDRVHACVATLAYGRPAMMWFDTPRNALLERVGLEFPMSRPVSIPIEQLEEERCAELEFLMTALR